jgi:murein DD-endopeptidase MepM/ murein hydrolase activator NlpD
MSVNHMVEQLDTVFYKLRFVFAGALAMVVLFLLLFLLSTLGSTVQAKGTSNSSPVVMDMSGSPNAVTGMMSDISSSMTLAAHNLEKNMNRAAVAAGNGAQAVLSASAASGRFVVGAARSGLMATARGVGKGVLSVGRTIGRSVVFVVSIPGNVMGFVGDAPIVRSVIQPADHSAEVPIIDPESPALLAALAALPAKAPTPAQTQNAAGPAWPIHGEITTQFGVPHRPYQATHSGLDITDHQPAGTTPIKPFRPGQVIDTVQSRYGLGNHVIVDHGNGVTSVYGHLHSISVQIGQPVDMNTTLGFEGTTGLSTGTHLHFEIRVNGQAADPRQFITGQP